MVKERSEVMGEKELVKKFNALCTREHSRENRSGYLALRNLSDSELFVFVAGKTLKYGRTFEDSIEKAKYHMKNRNKAERVFSRESEVA